MSKQKKTFSLPWSRNHTQQESFAFNKWGFLTTELRPPTATKKFIYTTADITKKVALESLGAMLLTITKNFKS